MNIERNDKEILIRLSGDVDLTELQDLLDYLQYKELTCASKANQKDVDRLANELNASIWEEIKNSRNI